MVHSRDCIASVSLGPSAFYIAQLLRTHHTKQDFAFTCRPMVDVTWSVVQNVWKLLSDEHGDYNVSTSGAAGWRMTAWRNENEGFFLGRQA